MYNKKRIASKNQPDVNPFRALDEKMLKTVLKRSCADQVKMVKQAEKIEKKLKKQNNSALLKK